MMRPGDHGGRSDRGRRERFGPGAIASGGHVVGLTVKVQGRLKSLYSTHRKMRRKGLARVADVFDALCSKRPYKEPMDFDAAMAILEKDTASHFDPGVMDAFRAIARKTYDRLAQASEDEARALMEERVRIHFGM